MTDWPGHVPEAAAKIAALVAAGADVNARFTGPHTETPLHWAASSDDVDALDALLDAGADIEADGAVIGGGTPIADAVAFGQWKAARRLLERGARTNLWQAAALGLLDRVRDELAGAAAHAGGPRQRAVVRRARRPARHRRAAARPRRRPGLGRPRRPHRRGGGRAQRRARARRLAARASRGAVRRSLRRFNERRGRSRCRARTRARPSRAGAIGWPQLSQIPYVPSFSFSSARSTRACEVSRELPTPTSVRRRTASVVPSPTRLPKLMPLPARRGRHAGEAELERLRAPAEGVLDSTTFGLVHRYRVPEGAAARPVGPRRSPVRGPRPFVRSRPSASDAQDYAGMDDLFIPLWPPAWVEDHTLSDEQLVEAGEDVRLMSAVRSDERVLLSVSWPGGRRYLMIDPHGDGAPEAFRAGETSADTDSARSIDAMWSQALLLAKQILDGELPTPDGAAASALAAESRLTRSARADGTSQPNNRQLARVQRGPESSEVGRPEDHAISRGDVDEIEVDSSPGDLASQVRQHAGAVLDIDHDDLALAGDCDMGNRQRDASRPRRAGRGCAARPARLARCTWRLRCSRRHR